MSPISILIIREALQKEINSLNHKITLAEMEGKDNTKLYHAQVTECDKAQLAMKEFREEYTL